MNNTFREMVERITCPNCDINYIAEGRDHSQEWGKSDFWHDAWSIRAVAYIIAPLQHGKNTEHWGFFHHEYGNISRKNEKVRDFRDLRKPTPEELKAFKAQALKGMEYRRKSFAEHLNLDYIYQIASMVHPDDRPVNLRLLKVEHDDGRISWPGITACEVVRREAFDYRPQPQTT